MSLYIHDHELLQYPDPFARLLDQPGVVEEVELRGTVGFMAFHGGQLEETTDVVAREAALTSGSSYYGVVQPPTDQWHIPSHRVTADQSERLAAFMTHIDFVIAIHGFGRPELWRSILIGGRNRQLAEFTAIRLIPVLPHYEVLTDLETIPKELRGQHQSNPVNRARGGGIQIELPPRVRGNSPIFWGRDVPTRVPHLTALIDALSGVASDWSAR